MKNFDKPSCKLPAIMCQLNICQQSAVADKEKNKNGASSTQTQTHDNRKLGHALATRKQRLKSQSERRAL